jgi:hypothetical protein
MLDSLYYVNLAFACEHAEAEFEAHQRNKEG